MVLRVAGEGFTLGFVGSRSVSRCTWRFVARGLLCVPVSCRTLVLLLAACCSPTALSESGLLWGV